MCTIFFFPVSSFTFIYCICCSIILYREVANSVSMSTHTDTLPCIQTHKCKQSYTTSMDYMFLFRTHTHMHTYMVEVMFCFVRSRSFLFLRTDIFNTHIEMQSVRDGSEHFHVKACLYVNMQFLSGKKIYEKK